MNQGGLRAALFFIGQIFEGYMTLDDFKATMRVMSPMEYDKEFDWFLTEITGSDEIVFCYGNGNGSSSD